MSIEDLEAEKAKYMDKLYISKLEQYVNTCDPSAVKYAIYAGTIKDLESLKRIERLADEFVDKCSCIKK